MQSWPKALGGNVMVMFVAPNILFMPVAPVELFFLTQETSDQKTKILKWFTILDNDDADYADDLMH